MNFLSPLFQNLFRDYSTAHADPRNRWTHLIGIPLIVLSTLGLLGRASLPQGIPLDFFIWAGLSLFYFRNAGWMSVPFLLLTLLLCVLARFVNLPVLLTFFIVGWVVQFIGHFLFEKASPSFMTNLTHLLIGPFWVYCYFVKRLPLMSEFFSNDSQS